MPFPNTPQEFKDLISAPTASMCDNLINTLLRLPVLIYNFIAYILDADGNLTTTFKKLITDLTLRPGDYIFSASALDTDGRLLCNGSVVSRATYADLFAAIGTVYGAGDGVTTFGIPDFSDRFPIGASGTKLIGTTGGSAQATLALANVPPHTHDCLAISQPGGSGLGEELFQANEVTSASSETDVTLVTESTGGTGSPVAATPFDVLNPYVATYIYVKT